MFAIVLTILFAVFVIGYIFFAAAEQDTAAFAGDADDAWLSEKDAA